MAGRPAPATAPSASLRVEILKELQQLIDSREVRDRLEKSAIAETKGREHWVLHLLLRAQESTQARMDTLIGSAYTNLLSRLEQIEGRIDRMERERTEGNNDLKARIETLATELGGRLDKVLSEGLTRLLDGVNQQLADNLGERWKPVAESIETFSQSSKQMAKDVADTYRVATQTRLLLNENARRITDLGRDLVALEESLKLVVAKTLEEGFSSFEQRLAALETSNGTPHDAEGGGAGTTPG
jgi:methyl-accepting chemotaxis protein